MQTSLLQKCLIQRQRRLREISVFLPTQLKGLHVVFRLMAHLDNTAVEQNSIGLRLRSAAMDTGDYMHGYTDKVLVCCAVWYVSCVLFSQFFPAKKVGGG